MSYAFIQLGHSRLLPPSISKALLEGNQPPISELMNHLLTTSMDAYFMTTADPESSWIDKRLSHQSLVTAFMLALFLERTFGPEHNGTVTTATHEEGL